MQVYPINSQRVVSSITNVKDSKGAPVTNGESTDDPLLTVSGGGTANSVVFFYDNGDLLTTASVTIDDGTWELTDTFGLGRHVFTVRDTLAGVDSPEWVVTVGEVAVKPEITTVTDSKGEVAPDGTTFDTTVTLSGTAAANEVVELFQDGALLGDVPVNASSIWTRPVTGLTENRHNFQVRGRYGNSPVSGIRSLTVVASAAPTIDSVKDAGGTEIPPDGTTFGTSVTLSGAAAADRSVQIFDGGSSLGTVTATDTTWTLALTGLALKAYTIKAKGLYGNNPESMERSFRIAVATDPTITHVRDSKGEVEPEGTTLDTIVILEGRAAAGQRVEILDDGELKGEVTVDGNGDWTYTLQGLTAKGYIITARGRYANNPVSQRRTFSVVTVGREDFEGYQGPGELPTGVNISFANGLVCLITQTGGLLKPHITTAGTPVDPSGKSLKVYSGNDPRFEFGRLIRTFNFTYHIFDEDASVGFYAADDAEIQLHALIRHMVTTVELTLSRPCAYCKFRIIRKSIDGTGCALDNLEWS